jgi:hypothetical protein
MLIREILNPQHREVVSPKKGITNRISYVRRNSDHIASGAFGSTVASKNPHEIIKNSSVNDNYNFFVMCVMAYNKKHGQVNPYFPRFYKVVTFKDKIKDRDTGDDRQISRNTVKMERLQPLSKYSASEIYELAISLFGEKDFWPYLQKEIAPIIDNQEDTYRDAPTVLRYDIMQAMKTNKRQKASYWSDGSFSTKDAVCQALASCLRTAFESNNRLDIVKDFKLADAIEWLYDCKIRPEDLGYTDRKFISWDIHHGNVMVRREGGRLQLVITDPFS